MKRAKTLGPIAVAAVFVTALLGPSLAMGESTSLCEKDETPCTSPVSHVHYVANDLEVLTSAMDYKCDVLFLADVSELGSPQVLEGHFTYTNCSRDCEREELNGPAILHFLKTGHESAKLTGEAEIYSFCSGIIECVYSFENLTGSASGPLLSTQANGEIRYVKVPLTHVSGFFCPETAYLDAKFVPLSATYISS